MTSYSASWNNVPNNEDAYSVERATSSDFSDAQEIDTTAADETAYVDRDVEVGQTYWYRVRASRADVNSGYSNAASATPLKSTVNIYATKSQTAEGGAEKGQFTIYRDGGDLTRALVVQLEVETGAGRATAGDDYDALPTFVTIPAGQKQVTLDVTAKTDEEAEDLERVVLAAKDSAAYAKGPHVSAWVQVLDKKQYIIGFSGLGPDGSKGNFGNAWLAKIVEGGVVFDYNQVDDADKWLFGNMDADSNHRISPAEAESADIRVAGFSAGGFAAAGFTRELFKDNERVHGYRLDVKIPVQVLVTLDPAGAPNLASHVHSNVQYFYNYYQQRVLPRLFMRLEDGNGKDLGQWKTLEFGTIVQGENLRSHALHDQQVRIEADMAVTTVRHQYDTDAKASETAEQRLLGVIQGDKIEHSTVPWYVATLARANLGLAPNLAY